MAIDLYRVTVNVQDWNGLNVNVFHCDSSTVAPADFGAAAFTLFSTFYGDIESIYTSSAIVGIGQIIDLSTTPVTYVPFDPTPFTMSVSGSRADARQAITVTWRSAVATKRGRGRSFLGPLNVSFFDDTSGLIESSYVTAIDSAAAALINSANVATIPLQVYSKAGGLKHPIIGRHVGRTVRTLRSRTLR